MKRISLILIVLFLFTNCSIDDGDNPSFTIESVAIESVELPPAFRFGETYRIKVFYKKPSNCHDFNNFYFERNENQRTVILLNSVFESEDCTALDNVMEEATFNFGVTSNEPYVFRFWQGPDDNGNDTYYIVEVPVMN